MYTHSYTHRIEESTVEIQCRPEDKEVVKKALAGAVTEYKEVMAKAGHKVTPNVTMSENQVSVCVCLCVCVSMCLYVSMCVSMCV